MKKETKSNQRVIMLLTNGFAPDLRVYKEAVYLVKKGFAVTVFCWDRTASLPVIDEIDSIEIKRCPIPSIYGTGFHQLSAFFKFLLACRQYMRSVSCDYLHCTNLDAMLISLFCKKSPACQLVFDMREFFDNDTLAKYPFFVKRIAGYLCARAKYVLYVNPLQIAHVNLHKREKYIYLPNYSEREKFNPIVHIQNEKIRVAYIGVVRHFQILKTLLDECSTLRDEVDVLIHGNGIDAERLRAYSEEIRYGLVTGMFDHQNVGALYANCDVAFCVYREDDANEQRAYPTKLFEAISARCPIIMQKGTLAAQFVHEHGIGFCVDWKEQGSIRAAIQKSVDNPELLTSMRAQMDIIRAQYVWEDVVPNMDLIFHLS